MDHKAASGKKMTRIFVGLCFWVVRERQTQKRTLVEAFFFSVVREKLKKGFGIVRGAKLRCSS